MPSAEEEALMRRLLELEGVIVEVGILGSESQDLITYAAANEFGVPGRIPERSFLRSTAQEQEQKWADLVEAAVDQILDGADVNEALGRVGLVAVRDVQLKITRLRHPPNARSTIDAKGSSNPLIDSGRMRASVRHQVSRSSSGS